MTTTVTPVQPESRTPAEPASVRRGALLSLLRPQRGRLAAAIGCGLLDQGFALAAALLGAALVGRALNGESAGALVPGLILLAALVLPKVLAAWAESYLAHDLASGCLRSCATAAIASWPR
ncbi:hypothetical protein ACBI99_16695 [Nonomuraea sp. ATR24]|uniref:hypothetical protein n=1 Tax=Nonomuraea sp. ATR24 TaxID=1676744 RepID=UPI0035C13494